MVELPKINTTELVVGGVAAAALAGVGIAAAVKHHRKKSRGRKSHKAKSVRKRVRRGGRKLKFGSKAYRRKYLKHGSNRRKQRKPHTAGKRKDTSRRRIRYTKNNQPYVILSSGKARFISKRSVSSSRKRRGGRY
jgi:hypothetical protein